MYVFNKEERNWLPCITVFDLFSPEESKLLSQTLSVIEPVTATVMSEYTDNPDKIEQVSKYNSDIRKSVIRWVPYQNGYDWFFARMARTVIEVNRMYYNFQLTGFLEDMQYTEYYGDTNDKFDWHQDSGAGSISSRKLSVTVQLSDPSEYEGGNLLINNGGSGSETAPRSIGCATIFPSWQLHCVEPVISGVRKSLVVWTTGEPFR